MQHPTSACSRAIKLSLVKRVAHASLAACRRGCGSGLIPNPVRLVVKLTPCYGRPTLGRGAPWEEHAEGSAMSRYLARQVIRNSTLGLFAAAGVGFLIGRAWTPAHLQAAPPAAQTPPPQKAATPSDYSQRVVAYIFGNVPITREDLGEYLIARQGYEKIDLLVNKRIIEHAASQRGITVTAAEIEAIFQDH